MLRGPSDIRRQGGRLLKMLEGINLSEPLGAGFHAELCAIARSLSQYKKPMVLRTGDVIEWPQSPSVWTQLTIESIDTDGFVWVTHDSGTRNRLSIEAIRKNARMAELTN